MELTIEQITQHLNDRKKESLELKDLRITITTDSFAVAFAVADEIMKHSALFEIDQIITYIEDFRR